jgi:hypothetical protein
MGGLSPSLVATDIPSARKLRSWLRKKRRGHSLRTWKDVASDAYLVFWVFIIYGWVLVDAVRDYLDGATALMGTASDRGWLGVCGLLAGAGLIWTGLRTVGPLVVGGAAQSWCLTSPIDRGRWLRTELAIAGAATAAALVPVTVPTALVGTQEPVAWALLAALVWGVTLAALATIVQPTAGTGGPGASAARWLGRVLLLVGAAGATIVVAARGAAAGLPAPPASPLRTLGLFGLPIAVLAGVTALSTLGRIDRAALGQGAALIGATATATVALDLSVLRRVIAFRRWRRIGWVRSRAFRAWPGGRPGVLLQAEFRRLVRRPTAWLTWGGLALAQAVVGVAIPELADATLWLGAYLVGLNLTPGLSQVAGSPGLRRALGGEDLELLASHLVLPTAAMLAWWAVTVPTVVPPPALAVPFLLAGAVFAVYRGATRPPMRYDDPATETPFGPLPTGLILQLLRGPDVLAGVLIAQFLLQR